jgi:hypothetical protein
MSSELNTEGILKIVEQNCELYKRKCIECEELRKELSLLKGGSSIDDKKIDDKPKSKPIIKSTFNSDKCYCRVWNNGLGTQCTREKKDGDYCKNHASKFKDGTLEFGSVNSIRPNKYSKHTKGKKEGNLIKWKHKEVIEDEELTEEVLKLQEDIGEELNELNDESNLESNLEEIEEIESIEKDDELDLDIDDECLIEGVEYNQFNAGDGIIYLLNEEGKKVAQWNGYNENSIEWSSTIDEINHNTMKTK